MTSAYSVDFSSPPMGIVLEGKGASLIVSDLDDNHDSVGIGDTVCGVNNQMFWPHESHSSKISKIGAASWPKRLHFLSDTSLQIAANSPVSADDPSCTPPPPSGVDVDLMKSTSASHSRETWRKMISKVTAVVRMRRPVSRARIGVSPIYQKGLTVRDHQGINDWFKETKAINNRKKKEHRKLFVGKRQLVRGTGAWQRPGMPFLRPIKTNLVERTNKERMKRHAARKQRRLAESLAKEDTLERHLRAPEVSSISEENEAGSEEIQSMAVAKSLLSPLPFRNVTWPIGSHEDFHHIISRGVRCKFAKSIHANPFFIVSVQRVQLLGREIGLRFVAFDIGTCRSAELRVPWSKLTSKLREYGRASLADRCLNCISFPSPEFERKARIFAAAAFLIHRVDVICPGSGSTSERQDIELVLVDIETGSGVANTLGTENEFGHDSLEPEETRNEGDPFLLDYQRSPLKHCIPSLPARAGVLRTALHPDHLDWHKILSRRELRETKALSTGYMQEHLSEGRKPQKVKMNQNDLTNSNSEKLHAGGLLQIQLEAIDALELVTRFNKTNSLPQMDRSHLKFESENNNRNMRGRLQKAEHQANILIDSKMEQALVKKRTSIKEMKSEANATGSSFTSLIQDSKESERNIFVTQQNLTADHDSGVDGPSHENFEVVFDTQSLGLGLGDVVKCDQRNSEPVVPSAVVISIENHCTAKGRVKVGDEVITVNGNSILGECFSRVLELIRTGPRPLEIQFSRPVDRIMRDTEDVDRGAEKVAGVTERDKKVPVLKKKKKKKSRKKKTKETPSLTKESATPKAVNRKKSPIPQQSISVPNLMATIDLKHFLHALDILSTQVEFLESILENHRKICMDIDASDEALSDSTSALSQLQRSVEKLKHLKTEPAANTEVKEAQRSLHQRVDHMAKEVDVLLDRLLRRRKLGKYSDLAKLLM